MINEIQALSYKEQLHPAFAGYIHDGKISERDVLGSILNLILQGIIQPLWKNDSMLDELIGLRKTNKKTKHKFEQMILNELFKTKLEITTKDAGNIIKLGTLQNIINNNLTAISTFAITNRKIYFNKQDTVTFSYNGKKVETEQDIKAFKVTALGIIAVTILIFILGTNINTYYSNQITFINNLDINKPSNFIFSNILEFGIFFVIPVSIFISFVKSKKYLKYQFKDNLLPETKKKYEELYFFIKEKPLGEHKITNTFLPYSIAFGLDESWQKDFGLQKEIQFHYTQNLN
jgi:hypothetical protein